MMSASPEQSARATDKELVGNKGPSETVSAGSPRVDPALTELLNSAQEREALRRVAVQNQRAAALLNPLGEDKDASPCLSLPFSKAVRNFFSSQGRLAICGELERVAKERLPAVQATLPPVFYLALVSPSTERFLKYLPDVRREIAPGNRSQLEVEARIWGVPIPSHQQVQALIDEHSKVSGYRVGANDQKNAQLACVKINGVVQLQALMATVTTRLDGLNPSAVWSRAGLGSVSAQQAAEVYTRAVLKAARPAQLPLLARVAEILWDGAYIARHAQESAEVALSRAPILSVALEAAVINRCGQAGFEALKKEIVKALNPTLKSRSASLSAVMSELNFSPKDPGYKFIRMLMTTADMGRSQLEMLKRACEAAGVECERGAIQDLRALRGALSDAPRPMQFEIDAHPEYRALPILESVLNDYRKVVEGNLLWKTAPAPESFLLSNGQSLSLARIERLLPTSRILAGIPNQELDVLLKNWNLIS